VLVAHACNSNFSGGRDQKDRGSKPTWANSSARDPISKKNPSQKRAGGVTQGGGSEFKLQLLEKKKKREKETLINIREGCMEIVVSKQGLNNGHCFQ
jgi:hypothetical protein